MQKVAIITRAYNRLEYTIRCINSVRSFAGYDNYEHIIVSQGSTDGTVQWLDWIKQMPNNWYSKVRPFHPNENLGDWNGMVYGAKQTDAQLLIHLDNDIEVPHPNWLNILVKLFHELNKNNSVVALLLFVDGAKTAKYNEAKPKDNRRTITLDGRKYIWNDFKRPVACFIMDRKILDNHNFLEEGVYLPGKFRKMGSVIGIINFPCIHMDGYVNEENYIQHEKYGWNCGDVKWKREMKDPSIVTIKKALLNE